MSSGSTCCWSSIQPFVDQYYWLDPSPDTRTEPVPVDLGDFVSVVAHELGHALGMAGTRSRIDGAGYGALDSHVNPFDVASYFGGNGQVEDPFGDPNPMFFAGAESASVFGADVPLSNVSRDDTLATQNFYHWGTCGDPPLLTESLMNGCSIPNGKRLEITPLDLAMIADLGYPLLEVRSLVTFVNPGSNAKQQSFLRFVNKAATPTDIEIDAFDDDGFAAPDGTVTTTLSPFASLQLTAQDLEEGNSAKALLGGLGDGTGKWQLAVWSSGSIEVISMIRTPDGFLTSVNDVVPKNSSNEIYFANPASNQNQQSFLRFTSQSDVGGFVTLSGVDHKGNPAPGTDITFTLGPRESKQLTSRDVENGNASKGLIGALGDGSGKWHLTAESDIDLEVMSLIRTPDGFLTNLSGAAPTDAAQAHRIYYANPASETEQATLIRVVNITTSTGTVTISGIDDSGATAPGGTVQFELGPWEAKQLLTTDLENGNASKGLGGALGNGAGKWQLTVTADMDIAVMNLIRTADGFLTNLSRVAPKSAPMLDPALGVPINTAEVYMANPGSNSNQRSLLRVVNTTDTAGTVTVTGIDDNGDAAPSGSVSFQIGANEGLVLTIQDIENGDVSKGLTGALGDGAGKWRLTVESTVAIAVMSLLDTPNGFITNLSRPSEN